MILPSTSRGREYPQGYPTADGQRPNAGSLIADNLS
jgi:hypothetical protein